MMCNCSTIFETISFSVSFEIHCTYSSSFGWWMDELIIMIEGFFSNSTSFVLYSFVLQDKLDFFVERLLFAYGFWVFLVFTCLCLLCKVSSFEKVLWGTEGWWTYYRIIFFSWFESMIDLILIIRFFHILFKCNGFGFLNWCSYRYRWSP